MSMEEFGKRLSSAGWAMTLGTIIGVIGIATMPLGIILIFLGIMVWIGGLVSLFEKKK